MSDIRAYTKEFLTELLFLYRSVPCLWRVKSKEFLDRNMKDKAWETIVNKLREVDPDTDKVSAMRKINSLKTSWRRENKKVRESMRSGVEADEVYVPKLWYFERLRFVEDEETPRDSLSNIDEEPLDPVLPEPNNGLKNVEDNEDETPTLPEVLEAPTQSTPTPRRDKRLYKSKHSARSRSKPNHTATDEVLTIMKIIQAGKALRDQYTVFGEQVGMQIRDLPSLHARKVVKQIINTVLFDAEMGKYDYPPVSSTQPSSVPNLYSQQPTFSVPVYSSMSSTSSIP